MTILVLRGLEQPQGQVLWQFWLHMLPLYSLCEHPLRVEVSQKGKFVCVCVGGGGGGTFFLISAGVAVLSCRYVGAFILHL